MAPKRTFATEQKRASQIQSAGVQKNTKASPSYKASRAQTSRVRAERSINTPVLNPTPFRRVTRSSTKTTHARAVPSPDTPTVKSNPIEPTQQALTTSDNLTEPLQSTRRKRRLEPEYECSDKRRRKDSPSVVEPAPSYTPLNRRNLKKLDSEIISETFDSMSEKKRSMSRRSSTTDMNQDTASQSSLKSSYSQSDYRMINLDRARIVIQHRGLPQHIQSRIDGIIQPETSEERKSVLFSIADSLCDAFPVVLEVASREDDSVELIYRALESMDTALFSEVFAFRRKADWDPILKPNVQHKSFHTDPLAESTNDTNDSLDRSSKRHQVEASYASPETSENTMPPPPPPLPPKQDACGVKTPRPDITIGFHHSVVANKLRTLGVGELDAGEILKCLQYDRALYSSPTQPALLIRFPSLVVEGKSYATGKTIYEAENQAAASGSCMLVVQHQLDDLTQRRSPRPESHQSKEPLAFSICSEGPIMLLYVHYTTSVQGARFYNMHLLEVCHATRRNSVRDFFMVVAGVMRWASSELLDEVAQQLFLVWKAAQP